jgi:hypothetical protein
MPYKWVEPQLYLEHKGVKVYRTYCEDLFEQPNHYWFTTDVTEDDLQAEIYEFDVRTLPAPQEAQDLAQDQGLHLVEDEVKKMIIRHAIEIGWITAPPADEHEEPGKNWR